MDNEKIAPCGLDCSKCCYYIDNIDEEKKKKVAQCNDVKIDEVSCKGCSSNKLKLNSVEFCPTYKCCKDKKLKFCVECNEYPCDKLHLNSKEVNKLYSLCRIKLISIDKWIKKMQEY